MRSRKPMSIWQLCELRTMAINVAFISSVGNLMPSVWTKEDWSYFEKVQRRLHKAVGRIKKQLDKTDWSKQ